MAAWQAHHPTQQQQSHFGAALTTLKCVWQRPVTVQHTNTQQTGQCAKLINRSVLVWPRKFLATKTEKHLRRTTVTVQHKQKNKMLACK
jgi:hypothetical protein